MRLKKDFIHSKFLSPLKSLGPSYLCRIDISFLSTYKTKWECTLASFVIDLTFFLNSGKVFGVDGVDDVDGFDEMFVAVGVVEVI